MLWSSKTVNFYAPGFSSETLALYKSLTYLLTVFAQFTAKFKRSVVWFKCGVVMNWGQQCGIVKRSVVWIGEDCQLPATNEIDIAYCVW